MRKLKLLIIAAVSLFLAACTPKFDQNAPYKDITVAYCLLNPNEATHYVKVYKAFLTQDNAIIEAGKLDNISYYNDITVSVEEYVNGHLTKVMPYTMTYDVPKDSGIFAYNPQVVYYNNDKLNPEATYKLKIVSNRGKVITAETPLVKDFNIVSPVYDIAYFLISNSTPTLKFRKAENATAYDIYLKFRYIEIDKNTGDTITPDGLISWRVMRTRNTGNSSVIEVKCALNNFFTVIASNLKADPNIIRYAKGVPENDLDTAYRYRCIDLEVWAAAEDLMTYMDVNTPSNNSIVQDRANFTNMKTEDGTAYGIFSSRNVTRKRLKLQNAGDSKIEDELVYGPITGHLGFQKQVTN
ncbi:MAG: hypothetical protein J6W84_06835 [Bacteroidales bacterium]|nr:hypothetical protein [Bacteroidales bacterium]MBQ7490157.1 hypothetical protein [Bacteroidales bacterium]